MNDGPNNKRKLTVKYDVNPTVKKSKMQDNVLPDLDADFDLTDFFKDDFYDIETMKLDLNTWQRCYIQEIILDRNETILKLKSEAGDFQSKCSVQGPWRCLKFVINELLTVQAKWDENHQQFCVTVDHGLIVQNPDFLISGTSVVGSLFCMRKGVLSDRFKGIDSGNKVMTIGSLVHELFQEVLKRKLYSIDSITKTAHHLLETPNTIFSLYSNNMTLQETGVEFQKYIPHIASFVKRYVTKSAAHKNDNNYQGTIVCVEDIEENIWMPKFGLKGKIDVTVKTSDNKIMPLEVKTGKSSFSLEHKGQVGLYQMMMAELNHSVDSGLLLYLKDGTMKEMSVKRNEQRDLIILRNNLSNYLTNSIVEEDGKFVVPELPEPINHHSACSKCPYNIICCAYLARDNITQVSSSNPIRLVAKDARHHLSDADLDYFVHWTGLVTLEHEHNRKENHPNRLWTKSLEKREKFGFAIGHLRLVDHVTEDENRYFHIFTRENHENVGNLQSIIAINPGDYVIVSTVKRIAIAAGHVQSLTKTSISILLERDLSVNYKNEDFIVDQYVSNSLLSFNLTNLGALIDCTESSNRLRKIIVEKLVPKFDATLPSEIAKKGKEILLKLNPVQRRAVLKSLATQDYVLIKGLPGTGKTQTLVALIQILVLLKKSVLLTSHTHSAVDNVLVRLKDVGVAFVRLGSKSRINAALHEHCEFEVTKNCKDPEELQAIYNQFNVVACTCHGSHHPHLGQRMFDVCIVDESTQVFQLSVIRPLLAAKKFILVGDPEQLPPIVQSQRARTLGADESLFARLDNETATFTLTLQYRMNKTITNLANKLTYKGSLQCANDELANMHLKIPMLTNIMESYKTEKWLLKALTTHVDQSVTIIDTGNSYEQCINFENQEKLQIPILPLDDESSLRKVKNSIYVNPCEMAVVLHLIDALLKGGIKCSAIGVIAPFRAQVEGLRSMLTKYEDINAKDDKLNTVCIEVNTVDQYQGRDKEIIIYSCTKSINPSCTSSATKTDTEILSDHRRLTVAITRAKHKLIIIGDVTSLNSYTPFVSLFQSVNKMSKIELLDGRMGFFWTPLLNNLRKIETTK